MIRLGFLGIRHVHAPAYGVAFRNDVEWGPVYDADFEAAEVFARGLGTPVARSREEVLASVDAVICAGTNAEHFSMTESALRARKHVLCEKPLVLTPSEGEALLDAARVCEVRLMTAFPCPYAPGFQKLQSRVQAGELGLLRAICATNHGRCPGGWFVDPAESGGGALVDHTVHVADLLFRLLGEEPTTVFAKTNHLHWGLPVEDSALVTLQYPSGLFATLDASWSRPGSYKTWGDVTLRVVGDAGSAELNLFSQAFDVYQDQHRQWGYGSNLDQLMAKEFLQAIAEKREPLTSGEDGLRACRVMWAAQRSAQSGRPEPLEASVPIGPS
ncbi:MAG TPA: Gfo/Idh/MocA family oxidoreductase [Fimbriimonadaceae bacterium]|nr:Gfo/Idh/MocA family oxidoreductase [Fimbriimonadaceae bacterium]HRJ32065.1 Gfo/Idh/MocA family oxidoreductase [Fimbriimonadaceae bacterium]